jgi:hypothetical protein
MQTSVTEVTNQHQIHFTALESSCRKASKRDGGHGCPCPVLAIFAWLKRLIAMTTGVILAFAIATGVALTTAFAFGLLPLVLM